MCAAGRPHGSTAMSSRDVTRGMPGRRLVSLGHVKAPKPLNLPSQKQENHGLDPNVNIIPKVWFSQASAPPLHRHSTMEIRWIGLRLSRWHAANALSGREPRGVSAKRHWCFPEAGVVEEEAWRRAGVCRASEWHVGRLHKAPWECFPTRWERPTNSRCATIALRGACSRQPDMGRARAVMRGHSLTALGLNQNMPFW